MSNERFAANRAWKLYSRFWLILTLFAIPWGMVAWFGFIAPGLGIPPPKGADNRMLPVILLLFAPFQYMLARRLFDKGPTLMIDRQGIWSKEWSDQVIPWEAIESVRIQHQFANPVTDIAFQKRSYVTLNLYQPELYPQRSRFGRLMHRTNRRFGYGDVIIVMDAVDATPEAVLKIIGHFQPRLAAP